MIAIAYVACAAVSGTTWFAIRVSMGAGAYPPYMAAALRFTLAAAILVALWWAGVARPGPKGRRQWKWLVAAGLLNAVCFALIYVGEESLAGGLTAVLFGTMPLCTALLAGITRIERPRRAEIVGALVSLVGIAAIFWDRLGVSAAQATGVLLVLAAVVACAGYTVIAKHHADDLNPLASSGVFLVVTAVAMWACVAAVGPRSAPWPPPPRPTLAIIYLGVLGSVVVYASYFFLLKRLSLMALMTLVFIEPLVALAVDAMWETNGVRATPRAAIGVAITLAGVIVSVLPKLRAGTLARLVAARVRRGVRAEL